MTFLGPRLRDTGFLALMGVIGGSYAVLVFLLLFADIAYVRPNDFLKALAQPEIQSGIIVTIKTCTLAAILSLWVGTALGYVLARFDFYGKAFIDLLVDIPFVLPPLVLGLSLLILFCRPFPGFAQSFEAWLNEHDMRFTFTQGAIVLAQFSVAAAFAVRTMRITFEKIDPRAEEVARTLGCSRMQAFLYVALPQSESGMITAFTISWARSLGEFGPILVFAGTTRGVTEVMSTSVFLELSVGTLESAVAVSLMMVVMAIAVLLTLRLSGRRLEG
ncbi:MAG: ABC transporter permease [Planctomycetaceae bacterium]|nr:ABC transporter permease [Planctomycetaceae bacterium]